ncbi:hypothetical protein KY317_00715 [Candidatus Woesearchaeota archaeon]|nr:hypothetical protein [Candidatus Woesearchaeota archaeon]
MKIIFNGGRQAGVICLLTALAAEKKIVCVIPEDNFVKTTAEKFNLNIKTPENINNPEFVEYLKSLNADLFICCHGRTIIKKEILSSIKCINIHPCLYKYKGVTPVKKLLEDNEKKASVGIHWMTEKVDCGETIAENFIEVHGTNEVEVYNEIYPLYSITLKEALEKIK